MSQPEIVLNCQACGGKLRAPRSAIGTTVGCPTCKTGVFVPDPTPKGFTPSVMIVDPRRKLGVESLKDTASTGVEDAFKERLRRTTEDIYRVDPNNPVMKRRDMRKLKHAKNLTSWDNAPQRRQRSARSRRILFALYAATGLILLLMGTIFWKSVKSTGRRPEATVIAPKTLETVATSEFSEQLWETIQNFCTAPTASDLLPFIRDPRRVGPKLIKYYNAENPWVPLALGEKPNLSDLEVHRDFIVLNLPLKDYTTIPLGLEKTKEGFLVDWESFTGYCELPWPELRQKRPRTPVLVRAVISPTEYFNLDFPSATTHRSYRISDLHSDHVLYGYVPMDGPADLQIKKTLLDAPSVHVVLRVRYPLNSTNDRQLEITEVLEKGWIFREDDVPDATDLVNTPGKVPTALPKVP